MTAYDKLTVGVLVFYDASTDDGTQVDHVGMYLGKDRVGTTASSPAVSRSTAPPLETTKADRY